MDKIIWRHAPAWGLDVDIQVITEHSVAMNLLPEKAKILDVGCRGFQFAKELARLGHQVYTIDPDPSVLGEHIVAYTIYPEMLHRHWRVAIAAENGLCGLKYSSDPQATTISRAYVPLAGFDIPTYTLSRFSEEVKIPFWDLIKMDIEGTEYEVIMSMDKPYCKQLSWEAHLHTGVYNEDKVIEMEEKLHSLGYVPAVHSKTKAHGMGFNFWDSLWVLNPTFRKDLPIKINQ